MIALHPEEMIIKSNDDLVMDFKVNCEQPVEVGYKLIDQDPIFLQGKYYLVTATVDFYEKQFSFVSNLGSFKIQPINENKFSNLAKKRWQNETKKKNMTETINSKKKKIQISKKIQTLISIMSINVLKLIYQV